MMTGMLWWAGKDGSLSAHIQNSKTYYEKKYGRVPNLVMVHPSMMTEKQMDVGTITVRPYRYILPGHIWIGIEDKEQK